MTTIPSATSATSTRGRHLARRQLLGTVPPAWAIPPALLLAVAGARWPRPAAALAVAVMVAGLAHGLRRLLAGRAER